MLIKTDKCNQSFIIIIFSQRKHHKHGHNTLQNEKREIRK